MRGEPGSIASGTVRGIVGADLKVVGGNCRCVGKEHSMVIVEQSAHCPRAQRAELSRFFPRVVLTSRLPFVL
jgi:hypothetical protein